MKLILVLASAIAQLAIWERGPANGLEDQGGYVLAQGPRPVCAYCSDKRSDNIFVGFSPIEREGRLTALLVVLVGITLLNRRKEVSKVFFRYPRYRFEGCYPFGPADIVLLDVLMPFITAGGEVLVALTTALHKNARIVGKLVFGGLGSGPKISVVALRI
jgi:hypothetical protein